MLSTREVNVRNHEVLENGRRIGWITRGSTYGLDWGFVASAEGKALGYADKDWVLPTWQEAVPAPRAALAKGE